MTLARHYDVVIAGAGPAGCCAALRMADLGYRVALVERSPAPHSRFGESLSPGIWNILEYIGVAPDVAEAGFLHGLPARVCWENAEPQVIPSGQRGPGLMVDRACFDALLLNAACARGIDLFRPATMIHLGGEDGQWRLGIRRQSGEIVLQSRLVFNATGRTASSARQCLPIGAETVALSTLATGAGLATETCIEALPDGWVWGSPHPGGGFRIQAFMEASALREPGERGLDMRLRALLTRSRLFSAMTEAKFGEPVRACRATAYVNRDAWLPGCIQLGEAAFAIDPLSSSGVEKAMRFTLQAVIAANTLLKDADAAPLARNFYQDRLEQAATTHAVWARGYYAKAAVDQNRPFWQARCRSPFSLDDTYESEFAARFSAAYLARERYEENKLSLNAGSEEPAADMNIAAIWRMPVEPSPKLRVILAPCVVNDRVELRPSVDHPNLERPLAYLDGIELAALLPVLAQPRQIVQLVEIWSSRVSPANAARLVGWLLRYGLLQRSAT